MEKVRKITILLFVMLSLLTLFYFFQGPIESILFQEMGTYPDAEEIVDEKDREEILSGSFLVGDMHLTSSEFIRLLQLDNISVYGVEASGFEVHTWYLAQHLRYDWARNNSWHRVGK